MFPGESKIPPHQEVLYAGQRDILADFGYQQTATLQVQVDRLNGPIE